jgi:ribosomal protein S12 methylthiotransferase
MTLMMRPQPVAQWQTRPEIDGNLFIDSNFEDLTIGDIITVKVDEAGAYDLWGQRIKP